MTREVVTIDAEATVQAAAERLLKHKVGCLPVLERGALVGIVTTSDVLHALAGPYAVAPEASKPRAGSPPLATSVKEDDAAATCAKPAGPAAASGPAGVPEAPGARSSAANASAAPLATGG
jgi:CBS domain-containing protein